MLPTFVKMSPKPEGETRNLVKYVEFKGNKPCGEGRYIETETSLFLEYMRKEIPTKNLQDVLDKLMLVKFKESNGLQIQGIFDGGLECERQAYNFLGHSRQQLKEKTCWLTCEPREKIHDRLSCFADFQLVEPVAKRATQIGVLFSRCSQNLGLTEEEYEVVDLGKMPQAGPQGAVSLGHGCGLISEKLCDAVKELYSLHEAPSVVHVRFQAYEGVLLQHPDNYMRERKALFTKTMEMFEPSSVVSFPNTLAVVDCSKPYSMGYLETLSVMMLEEMGVKRDYFEKLQDNYFKFLDGVPEDKDEMTWFMEQIGKIDLATKLQQPARIHEAREEVCRIQTREVQKMMTKTFGDEEGNEMKNYRVLVLESREVFGVRDPYSQLKSDECFFDPTLPDAARKKFELASNLLIMHRPCYNTDHVCTLKLVHERDNGGEHYVNFKDCLVFGGLSAVDKCSGGEMGDKNKFFVTWDKNLIPNAPVKAPVTDRLKSLLPQPALPTVSPRDLVIPTLIKCSHAISSCLGCASKPNVSEDARRKAQQRSELLQHFASANDPFSKAEELFMERASSDGISSEKCRSLSNLLCGGMDPYTNVKKTNCIIDEVGPPKDGRQDQEEAGREDTPLIENGAPAEKVWRTMGENAARFQETWARQ